eukprot:m.120202 g.120202  ORF g.120202 m.120202 type:complete len:1250 (-) comp9573_c0_seq1:2186-5935(-)
MAEASSSSEQSRAAWRRVSEATLQRKQLRQQQRDEQAERARSAAAQHRKVPMDMLAREWLDVEEADTATRVFMVEKVLMTLVPAMEKLLRDAEKRGALDDPAGAAFNPVDFLAQYLMRNNPKYSNFVEAGSYMATMKTAQEQLKVMMYEYHGNKKAKIHAEVQRRKSLVEAEDRRKMGSWSLCLQPLLDRVQHWESTPGQGISRAVLKDGLARFHDHRFARFAADFPPECKALSQFQGVDVPGDLDNEPMTEEQLCRFLGPVLADAPSAFVEKLAEFLHELFSKQEFANPFEDFENELKALFALCHPDETGTIDSRKLGNALVSLYESSESDIRAQLDPPAQLRDQTIDETVQTTTGAFARQSTPIVNLSLHRRRRLSQIQDQLNLISVPRGTDRLEFASAVRQVVGDTPSVQVQKLLRSEIERAFEDTPEDREERQARQALVEARARHRSLLTPVFEHIDINCSGTLDLDELLPVISKWRGVSPEEAKPECEDILSFAVLGDVDGVSFPGFLRFAQERWFKDLTDSEEATMAKELMAASSLNQEEEQRGQKRKAWLEELEAMSPNCFANPTPLYEKVFEIIAADTAAHVDANREMGALVTNGSYDSQVLTVVAATENAQKAVGQKMRPSDELGISFNVVQEDKAFHIPSIFKHGAVRLFCTSEVSESKDGSVLILPLSDPNNFHELNGIFGTLNIDTLPSGSSARFPSHQIAYFQGIARTLSRSLMAVRRAHFLWLLSKKCFEWIQNSNAVALECTFFLARKDDKDDCSICRVTGDRVGEVLSSRKTEHQYLFRSLELEQSTSEFFGGMRRTCFPLIGGDGKVFALVDVAAANRLTLDQELCIRRHLTLLTESDSYLKAGETPMQTEPPSTRTAKACSWLASRLHSDDLEFAWFELMYPRQVLIDVRKQLAEIRPDRVEDLGQSPVVNSSIHLLVRCALTLFLNEEDAQRLENWGHCRNYLTVAFFRALIFVDPTSPRNAPKLREMAESLNSAAPRSIIARIQSPAALVLHDWLAVACQLACLVEPLENQAGTPSLLNPSRPVSRRASPAPPMSPAQLRSPMTARRLRAVSVTRSSAADAELTQSLLQGSDPARVLQLWSMSARDEQGTIAIDEFVANLSKLTSGPSGDLSFACKIATDEGTMRLDRKKFLQCLQMCTLLQHVRSQLEDLPMSNDPIDFDEFVNFISSINLLVKEPEAKKAYNHLASGEGPKTRNMVYKWAAKQLYPVSQDLFNAFLIADDTPTPSAP